MSYLRPAAPVDVHADGTVGATAAHEEMSPVVRLHHPDEVPTSVLKKTNRKRQNNNKAEEEKHLRSHLAIKCDLEGFTAEDCLMFRLATFLEFFLWRDHIRVASVKTLLVAFLNFFHYCFMNCTKCFWGGRWDGSFVWDKPTRMSGRRRKLTGWTLQPLATDKLCLCLGIVKLCLPGGW